MERRQGSTSQSKAPFTFTLGLSNDNGVSPPREKGRNASSTTQRPSTSTGVGSRTESIGVTPETGSSSTFPRKGSLSSTVRPAIFQSNSAGVIRYSPEQKVITKERYSPPRSRQVARKGPEPPPKTSGSPEKVIIIQASNHSPPSSGDPNITARPYVRMLARPGTAYQVTGPGAMPILGPVQPVSPTVETLTSQHIQELSSKRVSTLDYLRKAYVFPCTGEVYTDTIQT